MMQDEGTRGRLLMAAALAAACVPLGAHQAQAAREHTDVRAMHGQEAAAGTSRESRSQHAHVRHYAGVGHRHHAWRAGNSDDRVAAIHGISCVPFARNESGIGITGDAADWWHNAAGVYARGNRPESGSVLNFRSNPHMPLGHVAVVKDIVDSRHVVIDHANWAGPGHVSRNVDVVDVSANNDWTAVRVGLGHTGVFGSVYPTYGFIYARLDSGGGAHVAANTMPVAMPIPVLDIASGDLRPVAARTASMQATRYEEVAEAPLRGRRGLDLSVPFLSSMDAPNRSLR